MKIDVHYNDQGDKSDPLAQLRVLTVKVDKYEIVVAWDDEMIRPVSASVTRTEVRTMRAR